MVAQLGFLVGDLGREQLIFGLAREEDAGTHGQRAGSGLGEPADEDRGSSRRRRPPAR